MHASGVQIPPTFTASAIWSLLSKDNDIYGLKYMASIFITILYYIWKARNESTFEDCRPSSLSIRIHLLEAISFSMKQINKPFVSNQLGVLFAFMRIARPS